MSEPTVAEVMALYRRVNKALTRVAKDGRMLHFAVVECGGELDVLLRSSADLLNAIVDRSGAERTRLDA